MLETKLFFQFFHLTEYSHALTEVTLQNIQLKKKRERETLKDQNNTKFTLA
jgi:hypothetical protein